MISEKIFEFKIPVDYIQKEIGRQKVIISDVIKRNKIDPEKIRPTERIISFPIIAIFNIRTTTKYGKIYGTVRIFEVRYDVDKKSIEYYNILFNDRIYKSFYKAHYRNNLSKDILVQEFYFNPLGGIGIFKPILDEPEKLLLKPQANFETSYDMVPHTEGEPYFDLNIRFDKTNIPTSNTFYVKDRLAKSFIGSFNIGIVGGLVYSIFGALILENFFISAKKLKAFSDEINRIVDKLMS